MSLQIELERIHSRAPIHGVTIAWWRKSGDEFKQAMQERNRSKVGRMARLKGLVETPIALDQGKPPALSDKVIATAGAMRKAGAPEADIEAFLKQQTAT